MDKIVLPLDVKELGEDDKNFTFEGYLAAFGNVDHGGDVINKGAFADFLRTSNQKGQDVIPTLWVHRYKDPIGVMPIKDMREDAPGLFVKAFLPKDDSFVVGRVMPQMRVGSVRKMSIGYDAVDWEMSNDGIRTLKKVHLWEGSLTPLAMNEDATVTSFKEVVPYGDLPLADRTRPWDSTSAIGRVREWAGVNEPNDLVDPDVQRRYRRAFFWFDGADRDLLGAYKLPFADVLDGRLTAIPRGIFAAAAAMRGARGGVFMPSNDRPGVTRNIERYYSKMGLESPFGKAFRIDDLAAVDVRDLEGLLRSGTRFSSKTSMAIISALKGAGLRDVETPSPRDEGNKNANEEIEIKLAEIINLFK